MKEKKLKKITSVGCEHFVWRNFFFLSVSRLTDFCELYMYERLKKITSVGWRKIVFKDLGKKIVWGKKNTLKFFHPSHLGWKKNLLEKIKFSHPQIWINIFDEIKTCIYKFLHLEKILLYRRKLIFYNFFFSPQSPCECEKFFCWIYKSETLKSNYWWYRFWNLLQNSPLRFQNLWDIAMDKKINIFHTQIFSFTPGVKNYSRQFHDRKIRESQR
jgi:hypothetical protein